MFLVEALKIMGKHEHIKHYGTYNVLTQEVGGCFDVLHRYYSLRCLVPPIFLLKDQFPY